MSKNILITRDERQALELVALCGEHGLVPVVCPLIKIQEQEFVPSGIEGEGHIKVLIFTSRNSVRLDILNCFPRAEIVAVGEQTARAIRALGFEVVLVSSRNEEVSLGADVSEKYNADAHEIVLFQGNSASSYLYNLFLIAGYRVSKHVVYEVMRGDFSKELFSGFIKNATEFVDEFFITLLSSYTAERFFNELRDVLGEDMIQLVCERVRFVVIGEKTASFLKSFGVRNVLVPSEKSVEGVLKLVEQVGGNI